MENNRNWYAVYVRPKAEKRIIEILGRKNIKSFYPTFSRSVKWEDARKTEQVALFESILFVYLTKEEQSFVSQIHGVLSFLYWLKEPAVIDQEEINTMQWFLKKHDNINAEKIDIAAGDSSYQHPKQLINSNELDYPNENDHVERISLSSLGYALVATTSAPAKRLKSVA